jgi:hypothetical protein
MSHYVFFFFFCNVCNVWMLYKREKKKKTEKWGRGVNCEEEMRGKKKNEMGEEGCMCVVGEKKKER